MGGDVAGDVGADVAGDVGGDVGGDMAPTVRGDMGAHALAVAAANRARDYASSAVASATRKAYRADLADFAAWCRTMGTPSLPAAPEVIGAYLAAQADRLAVSTLQRRLAAIAVAHRLAGRQLDTKHPAIQLTMRGIRRQRGSVQRQAAAATTDVVLRMAATCDGSLIGLRDRAALLVGFASAMRRGELVALRVEDVQEVPGGMKINIRRSKTDAAGEGQLIGIARTGSETCPVAAAKAWMNAAGISDGPLFRSVNRHGHIGGSLSDRAVAQIVKARAQAAGLDPERFSGHSLRAGLATSAAAAGAEERHIAEQTRHRSLATLRKYVRAGALFTNNVSSKVGL